MSGCAVASRQAPSTHQGARLGGGEVLEAAQDEAAGELLIAQLAKPRRDLPRRRGVGDLGDVGGLAPAVLHGLDVVAQHRRAGAEALARRPESVLAVAVGPCRLRGDGL